MDKNKVKLAFVGTGSMGQCAHLKNYAKLGDECEVIALAELREDVGQKVAVRYGISNVYKEAGELLANEKPDGLVASQQFSRHGIILEELVKSGIPIFIEKPLASSVSVGEKIVSMVKDSDAKIMVGYNKRSEHAVEYAKKEIENIKKEGTLGAMKYVRIIMPPGDWIEHGFDDLIRGEGSMPKIDSDPPADDMDEETFKQYQLFVNYYIHQVNLMRFLMGEPYQVTYADKGGVVFVCRSENGITGTIEMNPYRTTKDWQEQALVCFEKGYIKIDILAPLASNRPGRVEIFKDPGEGKIPEVRVPYLEQEHSMKNQARNFLAFVRGERPAPCRAEEALEDLRVSREYIRLFLGK